MARRIKGITIEIDGETRGLEKALADVNKRSREVSKELRDVERLLKFSPGNTELLAQKQKLLAEQVQITRERLEKLKSAQDQVTEAFKRGEISEEQYRAFQREIIETESKLKHFESQLNSTKTKLEQFGDSVGKAGEKMKSVGDKMTSVGKNLSMKVTAPLAAMGGAAVKTGIDFEKSMSKVQALSGATADEMQKLEEQARELGKTTVFSASQAADAQAFLAMAGYEVNQILESMPGLLDLAAAAQMDLGRAADITTNIMSSFGIEAERTGHVADVLAKASANANTNVEQMGEAIKYLGPVAASLGWDLEQSAAAVMSLSNAGIQGSMAGQAFASSLARLAKPTREMENVMKELGISFFDAQGNMKSMPEVIAELEKGLQGMTAEQKSAALSTLFGAEAYKHWAVLLEEGSETLAKNTQMLVKADGAARQMADTMSDNLAGKLNQMKSAFQEVALIIYENMLPAIEWLVEFLRRLAEWFGELSPTVQNAILIFSGLAAALGPVLIVLGLMAQGLGSILTFISSAITFLPQLGAAFTALTGPIGIVVAAIAALIAIGVLLWKNWDTVKDKSAEIWNAIAEFLSGIWESIKSVAETVWNAIVNFLSSIWDGITGIFNRVLEGIKSTIEGYWNGIKDGVEQVWNGIATYFKGVWELIKNIFVGAFLVLLQLITGQWEDAKKSTEQIWNNIKNALAKIWEGIKNVFSGALKAIVGFIKTHFENAKQTINTIWNFIRNFLSSVVENIRNAISIGFQRMRETISGTMNSVRDTIQQIWNNILSFLRGINLYDIGRNIIRGMIDGIKSMARSAVDAVRGVVDDAIEGAKRLLGIRSPSRVFMQIGQDTGEGLELGLRQMAARVKKASEDMVAGTIIDREVNVSGDVARTVQRVSNMRSGDIIIQQMIVRSDEDIKLISRELHRLQQARGRGMGYV